MYLSLSLYIYIYISISLSLYIYIYIYIYVYRRFQVCAHGRPQRLGQRHAAPHDAEAVRRPVRSAQVRAYDDRA